MTLFEMFPVMMVLVGLLMGAGFGHYMHGVLGAWAGASVGVIVGLLVYGVVIGVIALAMRVIDGPVRHDHLDAEPGESP